MITRIAAMPDNRSFFLFGPRPTRVWQGNSSSSSLCLNSIAISTMPARKRKSFSGETNTGAEVDLVLERYGELIGTFEIKSATEVSGNDFSGLRPFRNDNPAVPPAVVYRGIRAYRTDGIRVIPWKMFLDETMQEIAS